MPRFGDRPTWGWESTKEPEMSVRNPSELARLEEELAEAVDTVKDLRRPKGTREDALREVRRIEKILDRDVIGNYNA